MIFMARAAAGVPIDLTDATPTVSGPTTLHIEGISTLGASYWADFKWDDSRNVFSVTAYGEEGPPIPDDFEWIPPGTLTMGSPPSELGRRGGEGEHPVILTRGFYMAQAPVTQAQWFEAMGTNPSWFSGCDDCPVETVTWYDAVAYCNTHSAMEARDPAYEVNDVSVTWAPDADGYRLPTESEWEYSCRAGSRTAF